MAEAATSEVVRIEPRAGGAIWSVILATPKANILDSAKCAALREAFHRTRLERDLKALVLAGEGPHFSFGASVEEHLPGRAAGMLAGFHAMLLALLECGVPCLAAVRGQCLGGGLELAALCHRVFAARDARLGQPEILLGVFAPAASALLAERVGRGEADDLLLTGRSLSADEAAAIGLVDELAEDPRAAALDYAERHLLPKSAASLRLAVRAARRGFAERFRAEIRELERLYLGELMQASDPHEGLRAFLEQRAPQWRNT